jgi:hypothetical protein
MIKLSYLFRTKKYGKWNEGSLEINSDIPKSDYSKNIRLHLEREYPESTRIQVQSIKS